MVGGLESIITPSLLGIQNRKSKKMVKEYSRCLLELSAQLFCEFHIDLQCGGVGEESFFA